ncbi:hypothetical protein PY365_07325 [Roseiarcaceae bacterium H3SJ34-1]|uniref:hypothetical protein n=1 Tax=Terripilifer ovatus TaxID=3032367 RepID=UPI003AB945CD|nr:hypothetical protein [Roseiarcaceae bacterium H3SJ34-1]
MQVHKTHLFDDPIDSLRHCCQGSVPGDSFARLNGHLSAAARMIGECGGRVETGYPITPAINSRAAQTIGAERVSKRIIPTKAASAASSIVSIKNVRMAKHSMFPVTITLSSLFVLVQVNSIGCTRRIGFNEIYG